MAIIKSHITHDATLYSEYPVSNTGLDAILEIGNYISEAGSQQITRFIIKYDENSIQDLLNTYSVPSNFTSSLHLFLAEGSEIPTNFNIELYPLSENWDEGIGNFGDLPIDYSGVSWKTRLANKTGSWETTAFSNNVTGSFLNITPGGGTWYFSSSNDLPIYWNIKGKKYLETPLDITPILQLHLSEELPNNGIIFKLESSIEETLKINTRLKYFSSDTQTIYSPFIYIKWDDSVYSTGSLNVLENSECFISVNNNKGSYYNEESLRFRLNTRPKHPVRTFTTSSIYIQNYALPSESYWSIIDETTGETVVPFDKTGTKISCDSIGPYFRVFMNTLEPERYYRVLIKTEIDGSTTILGSSNNVFKVLKNG